MLAYPLVSRGERFPFAASRAEAFMLGSPAGEEEHFAALLLGVALVERLCFDVVDLLGAATDGQVTLTGGGTRSRAWCRLRADVLGRPVRLVEQSEAAVGMAILASSSSSSSSSSPSPPPAAGDLAGAAGGVPATAASDGLAAAAARMVRTREIIEPRAERAAALMRRYVRLVAEFERRGWLAAELADHARDRAGP